MNTTVRIVLCTLALTLAPHAGAGDLGRLFFTPEQRAQFEYDKMQNGGSGDSQRILSVSGIVQRNGGERVVWINGVPQVAGSSDEQSPESVPVAVPGQSQPVKVKVGQKVLLNQSTQQGTQTPRPAESDD